MTPNKSFLLALICLFFGVLEPRAGAEKLIADYGGHAGFQSAVWVANDFKLFEKYRPDAEVIMITGSARSVAALMGGSTQLATGSATGPLAAAIKGSDIKILAASYNKFPYSFVVKPEICTPKDLRGDKEGFFKKLGS